VTSAHQVARLTQSDPGARLAPAYAGGRRNVAVTTGLLAEFEAQRLGEGHAADR